MSKLGLKQKTIVIAIVLGTLLTVFLYATQSKSDSATLSMKTPSSPSNIPSPSDKPQIVSTKPDPLEDTIVSTTETVEITFNRPLENAGEFKIRIEPKIDYKVELSGDRKTVKIITIKPYQLGTTYTLFIGTETKFDGLGRWGEEKVFHFRTISYRGV